jgi:hypothetical protein
VLQTKNYAGPVGMIPGSQVSGQDLDLAGRIVAAYSDAPVGGDVTVAWLQHGTELILRLRKQENAVFRHFMIE